MGGIYRIRYFDGIQAVERICIYVGQDKCIINELYEDGTELPLTWHGHRYIPFTIAVRMMDEVRS